MAFSDLPLAVGNEKANSQKLTASSEIPCNKCATCLSITDGSNMDLIEIDAASNRGIEDIRSLRDKIKLSPTTGKKKVYIIDEVHMLTPEAFNALLKTLEEPPAHALFVLATTEASKLPQTILSRVQRLDFKLAESQELEEALKKIIKSEKVEIDEEALKIIAKKAEGSFRDGVKLLDQLASMGEKITVKFVSDNFRSSQFENILDLIKNLKNKPARKKCDGAYVVTVDMGYGHQRAAYPLKDIAVCPPEMDLSETRIITANNYPGIPAADRRRWEGGRKIYEKISRMFRLPFLGRIIFGIMDYVQRIDPFYPRRDLSHSTFQVRQQYGMIHRGWGKDLIERLNKRPLPLITSFFTVAFFAEEHEYQGEIYCLCTDTDISRAWVPMFPQESRIKYFAPNKRVRERLILYGINKENIFVTGFPLPKENIGKDLKTLKSDLNCRLVNLDPAGKYKQKYKRILNYYSVIRIFIRTNSRFILAR